MRREEAIAILKKGTMFEPTLENKDYTKAFDMAIKALEQEPKGKWIETGNKGHIDVDSTILYQEMCDKCKGLSYFRKSCGKFVGAEYCPNCGAKMEAEWRSLSY